jgi:transposase
MPLLPVRHYIERRTNEGLSKREAVRCLKRYVASELYPLVTPNAP